MEVRPRGRPTSPNSPEPRQVKYPHKPYKYTEAEYLAFEKRSFENAVHFYQNELRKILAGAIAHEILTVRDRKHLTKHGILTRNHKTSNELARCKVSPQAVEILKTI